MGGLHVDVQARNLQPVIPPKAELLTPYSLLFTSHVLPVCSPTDVRGRISRNQLFIILASFDDVLNNN